jgi:hypothetical protein
MLHCDFSNSSVIRLLFRLRGIKKEVFSIQQLPRLGFIKLEDEPGKEILFGMVTDSPLFNTCQTGILPKEFLQLSGAGNIKAVINFRVEGKSNSQHLISTETRVWCGSQELKMKFSYYWFFVKPFSQLIRKSMLKQLKLQILQSQHTTA